MIDVEKDLIPEIKNGTKKTCNKEETLLMLNIIDSQLDQLIDKGWIRVIGQNYDAEDVLMVYEKRKKRNRIIIIVAIALFIIVVMMAINMWLPRFSLYY